jgi:glycosyltransferase involved in cell wall biosynthesis
MKALTHTGMQADNVITRAQSPIKVCMHVRGTARTDGRVMREATALVEEGFTVSIVDVEHERNQPVEDLISGVHVKHVFPPSPFLLRYFKPWTFLKAVQSHIYSTYQLIKISADVYHAHDVSALPACYIAARLCRKPLIFDAHELPLPELHVSHWLRLNALLAYFLNGMVSHCDSVITVSPPIAQEIRSHYHLPEVALIRNIPAYQVVPKSDRLRQYLGLGPEVRIALYQGNLQSDRALNRLIQAASFLEQDIVIVMMGKVIGTTQSELEYLINSEGVADRIKIIPPVSYTELLDWTASADIGLIVYSPDISLNVQMCLPNKLFEYLMAGLPVLASSLDAVAEILSTYDVGQIVPSLAAADIGTAINAILADHVALARMHRNALEAVQRDLCWEKERGQLIQLYQNILGQNIKLRVRKASSNSRRYSTYN